MEYLYLKESNFKSGFAVLIGRPSTGKSTLINNICGYKISAVSNTPQTTQYIIRGIYNDDESQIIFIDTPGYHHYDSNLNKGLSNLAVRTLKEADIILYLVDLSKNFGEEEDAIIKKLKSSAVPIILVYNKLDLKNNESLILQKDIESRLEIQYKIEISSLNGTNVKTLISLIKSLLPEGPMYYPPEFVTDQTIPFRIKEIIREKICNFMKDEIPHATYVDIEKLDVTDKKITAYALIFIERESQKGMIIGKGGKMIKKIGESARIDLKEIFERDIDLFINVKTHYKWRRKDDFLKKKFNLSNE
jgi:GTP-binding protein Era